MQEKKASKNLRIKKLTIIGVIPSFAFQRAKYCALELHKAVPQRFPLPQIVGLLELDWSEKLQEWRQSQGKEYWCLRRPVAVFFDDRFIGSDIEFIKLTTNGNVLMENIPRKNMSFIKEHFKMDYINYLKKTKRIYCYLDICVDDVYVGTLTFALYSDLVPRTCENFKTLCIGSKGPFFTYRGSQIHRIVKGGWLQGGDIQYKTGGGGFSIFCDPLVDENFGIPHDRRGVLSMANCGRNTIGSQFFITLKPSRWMDTNYVAFGQLIEGVTVLKKLENLETFYECPLNKIEIKSCGKLDLGDPEDIAALFEEVPAPIKKSKKIETICDQIMRMIMEALTEALVKKEYPSDILDEGDVPSAINLQLYFEGLYSLPKSVLEEAAQYLRSLRRELLRVARPIATEVVEVIMYDLLMAVLTRMVTLDDVRETLGHEMYQKMISGIDMDIELCQKPHVKRLVNQIVTTAENMVDIINKRILKLKRKSENLKKFQDRMQNWVQSFVMQETFKGDNYLIAQRRIPCFYEEPKPVEHSKRMGKQCCETKKGEKQLKEQKRFSDSELDFYNHFSTCRYDLKRVLKEEKRMPLLDLIELNRFQLRLLRKRENEEKTESRLCLEKKLRQWMNNIIYNAESNWLKECVFPRDCLILDHMEEIMYGAMTAGLLEMYYFVEQYLKECGKKKQRLITRTIHPEGSESKSKHGSPKGQQKEVPLTPKEEPEERVEGEPKEEPEEKVEGEPEEEPEERVKREPEEEPEAESGALPEVQEEVTIKAPEEPEEIHEDLEKTEEEKLKKPCPCGHPCCKCEYDRTQSFVPEEEKGELEEEPGGEESEDEPEEEFSWEPEESGEQILTEEAPPLEPELPLPPPEVRPCASDETLVDINALLAESLSFTAEEIDITSFNWLKSYILEKGCDLKSQFASQVHQWLEGERFSLKGFISKHSLVTKASLLSLSLSLAELLREENKMKEVIQNFIFDLWELYFQEMIKEAYLQNPLSEEEIRALTQKEQNKLEDIELVKGSKERVISSVRKRRPTDLGLKDYVKGFDKYGLPSSESTKEKTDLDFDKFRDEERKSQTEETEEEKLEKRRDTEERIEKPSKELREPEGKAETPGQEPEIPQESSPPPISISPTAVRGNASVASEEGIQQGDNEEKEEQFMSVEFKTNGDSFDDEDKSAVKIRSPIVIQELVDEPSKEEIRDIPPYKPPFWVKFLTELTKQALGTMSKVSRLPRRLYFKADSVTSFEEKLKDWFEFNAFNPQHTKGRDIMDYIAVHHKSLTDLEDTARSYLKKKNYTELLNKCSRIMSAENMANEILGEVIDSLTEQNYDGQTLELYMSRIFSSAIISTQEQGMEFGDNNTIHTDESRTKVSNEDEEEEK